jgi:gamma-glutamylcyclotransferase (GGCT)/AIG2-like uncharacterized protein YtfP
VDVHADTVDTRLATYGSLAPGSVNGDQLAPIEGTWREGIVRGHLLEAGWGTGMGYPGIVLDPGGPEVDVWLLESAELPAHLERLDDFEGDGYARVVTTVSTEDGDIDAWIYVLAK